MGTDASAIKSFNERQADKSKNRQKHGQMQAWVRRSTNDTNEARKAQNEKLGTGSENQGNEDKVWLWRQLTQNKDSGFKYTTKSNDKRIKHKQL